MQTKPQPQLTLIDAQRFVRELLPELLPYAVLQSQRPTIVDPESKSTVEFNAPYMTNGFACNKSASLAFEAFIKARGDWCGRFPTIWIDDRHWQATLKEFATTFAEKSSEDEFLWMWHKLNRKLAAIVGHEAAHLISPSDGDCEPYDCVSDKPGLDKYDRATNCLRELSKRGIADFLRDTDSAAVEKYPGFIQHGARFTRSVIHLAYRSRWRSGTPFDAAEAFDTLDYNLPPMPIFERALGDEPQRLLDVPASEIHLHPMPTKFLKRLNDAVYRWIFKFSKPNSDGRRVAESYLLET